MYRIFSYKKLLFLSLLICVALLFSAGINSCVPVAVFSEGSTALPVIMYHQISENRSIYGDYVIPASLLEEDFKYFKEKGITPVSLKAVEDFLENKKPLPEKAVVLTFDDGERSFLTKVVPLLEKYGYPANINIIGSLTELYTKNGETDDRYAYLNESDIKALSENPLIELGYHSFNLHSLSSRRGMGKLQGESDKQYKKVITEDMEKFNELFIRLTGESPEIFAYPYGIRNDLLFETAKKRGFKVTLTCRESINHLKEGDSLYELGRFNRPYGISSEDFFGNIGL